MTDAAKQARREYKRKWQRENRDKVKEYQTRYWNKKAEQAEAEKRDAEALSLSLPY